MNSTIRLRLTFSYVLAFGALLATFSIYIYSLLARDLSQRFDDSLARSARSAATYFSEFAEKQNVAGGAIETVRDSQFGQLRSAILRGTDVLASSDPVTASAVLAAAFFASGQSGAGPAFATDRAHNARLCAVRTVIADLPYAVAMVEPLDQLDAQLAAMRTVFLLGIPLALAFAAVGGYALAGKSLEPMIVISEQAALITARNLSSRLDVRHPGDETGRLALVINSLLERLDVSFRVMREFMADASHELRTPTAIIQGQAEIALSKERSAAEYREALGLIHQQSRRMGGIVGDMLVLARADSGQSLVRPEDIYLNDIVEECCKARKLLADAAGITLQYHAPEDIPFRGDPELLKRMTANLLDNAIRYTPAGGEVQVRLASVNGHVCLTVADTGIGIPQEAQGRVFDRFFRGPQQGVNPGHGLGLSIVKVAAESHRGSVSLASEPGRGTTFTVSLPAG